MADLSNRTRREAPDANGRSALHMTYKLARRIVIAVIGTTVLLIGLAMTVLPGPAIVVIPAGLAILGLEFAWARRWLRRVKVMTKGAVKNLKRRRNAANQKSSGQ